MQVAMFQPHVFPGGTTREEPHILQPHIFPGGTTKEEPHIFQPHLFTGGTTKEEKAMFQPHLFPGLGPAIQDEPHKVQTYPQTMLQNYEADHLCGLLAFSPFVTLMDAP